MEEQTQLQNDSVSKPSSSKKRLITIVVSVVLVILIACLTAFFLRRSALIAEVSSVLDTVPAAMSSASDSSGNGFPVTLPSGIKKDSNVSLSGGGAFDGTTYCVTGTSLKDHSIVYHVDSSSKKSDQGACQSIPIIPKPTTAPILSMTVIGTTQIGLTWPLISGVASYSLQCAADTVFTQNVVQTTSANNTENCSNLKPGLLYYARVRANNSAGAGPWSSIVSLKTSDWSAAPSGIDVKATSSTSITYSWSSISGATSYVVEWATDTSYMKDEGTRELSGTSGTLTSLKPATQYYFHIKAVTPEFDQTHAAYSETVSATTPAS
jgi:hypothetical protein